MEKWKCALIGLLCGAVIAIFLTSQIGASIDSLNVLIIWVFSLIGMTALGYKYGDWVLSWFTPNFIVSCLMVTIAFWTLKATQKSAEATAKAAEATERTIQRRSHGFRLTSGSLDDLRKSMALWYFFQGFMDKYKNFGNWRYANEYWVEITAGWVALCAPACC